MLSRNLNVVYDYSISQNEEFWNESAREAVWSKPYERIIEDKYSHSPKWFVGGEINMSYNCLDRHVADGHGDDVIVIHDSPITGTIRLLTYNQLLESVSLLAGVLVDRCGMKKGDIVLLYFPMIPECLISMLACARIGLTYLVVYGGFSEKELSNRIIGTEPKMVLTCNAGSEFGTIIHYKDKLDSALAICGYSPQYCLVFNRPNLKPPNMGKITDLDWTTELLKARPQESVPLSSDHPLFLIFTSGTTGQPKCLVHLTGNTVVGGIYNARYLLGFQSTDTFWGISNFGWIVGQSGMSYGALLLRYKTIVYEGPICGVPDNQQFCRVLNWHKVTTIVCTPTVMRMLQKNCSKSDLELNYKGPSSISLGGEVIDPLIMQWASETFGCDVLNIYGQTEIIGAISRSAIGIKGKNYTTTDNGFLLKPPGLDIRVVNKETGVEVPNGTSGRIVFKLPLYPSLAGTFYKNEERFYKTYFERYPGYYDTMDAGFIRDDGSIRVEGREDDVLNVGGARICSTAVEEACLTNKNISQAVVTIKKDELLGEVPFAFLIRSTNVKKSDKEIVNETIRVVENIIGEVAQFKHAVVVLEFPRTVNGKIPRHSLSAMINGETIAVPGLVVNDSVYLSIHKNLIDAGYESTLPKRDS